MHIISSNDLDKSEIYEIFELASTYENLFIKYRGCFKDQVLNTVFFQPSTRTRLSFSYAFSKLGGTTIGFSNKEESRSGNISSETTADLSRIIDSYGDVFVARSDNASDIYELSENIDKPFINAGAGQEEHPTQAILDAYCIHKFCGRLENLNILIVGNIAYRTINSLLLIISKWKNNRVHIIKPDFYDFNSYFYENREKIKSKIKFYNSFDDFFKENKPSSIDIIYYEELRSDKLNIDSANSVFSEFLLNKDIALKFSPKTPILHPLPRTTISSRVDNLPNARYFEQARFGVFIRAAIFIHIFRKYNMLKAGC
tara:strand:+ start:326 stop:1267 length:942 start_codon:yes stop_codon:yes gene_type:complete